MLGLLRGRLFYGWYIAFAGAVMQGLVGVLMGQSFGAYAKVLTDEFQWSKTLFSAAFSSARVETGILGPIEGWMIDRWGPRAIMRLGVVMLGVGFMLFSQITAPWMFITAFLVMSFGGSFASFMPISVAIVNWFERRRARALSIMGLGMASGGLLVPALVYSMEHFGWRPTAFGSGVLVIVIGLPLAQVIRHRPEAYSMHKDGIDPAVEPAPNADGSRGVRPVATVDYTAKQAMRTPAFWLVALGHGSALLIVSALQVHLVLHVTENLGYSLASAASVVALVTIMQFCGQALTGMVGDRWNKRAIVVVCMGMHAVAILMLAFATSVWMVFAFGVLHGVAWGARGPLMAAIRADYFGGRNFGTIMGTSSLIASIGTTAGPLIAGILADRSGNYETGFTVLAVLAALGSIFFILARPPARLGPTPPAEVPAPEAAATPAS